MRHTAANSGSPRNIKRSQLASVSRGAHRLPGTPFHSSSENTCLDTTQACVRACERACVCAFVCVHVCAGV
jgi:hypothetical protein